MEELLKLLEQLYSETDNCYVGEDGRAYFKTSELYYSIETLCDTYLVTNRGACNWSNIRILKANGYDVFAGDKDSFGWITGCIQKDSDDRVFVYG